MQFQIHHLATGKKSFNTKLQDIVDKYELLHTFLEYDLSSSIKFQMYTLSGQAIPILLISGVDILLCI